MHDFQLQGCLPFPHQTLILLVFLDPFGISGGFGSERGSVWCDSGISEYQSLQKNALEFPALK